MPFSNATSDRRSDDVPPGGRPTSGVDRVITGVSWWWAVSPLILLTPAIAFARGLPEVREEFGEMFGMAALISATAAPLLGFVVALVARRQRARRRFVIMGTVTSVPVLFFLIFGVLLPECPDGYHCQGMPLSVTSASAAAATRAEGVTDD